MCCLSTEFCENRLSSFCAILVTNEKKVKAVSSSEVKNVDATNARCVLATATSGDRVKLMSSICLRCVVDSHIKTSSKSPEMAVYML